MDKKNPMEPMFVALREQALELMEGQILRNFYNIPVIFGYEVGYHEGALYRIQVYALPQFERGLNLNNKILLMSTIDIHGELDIYADKDYIDEMRGILPELFWIEVVEFANKMAAEVMREKMQSPSSEC